MAIKTFTTGEVLTAADTNTYLANSGLVFVKSQTVGSGVSSVTVADAFSATYDNYVITLSGGAANGDNGLFMQLGATDTGYRYTMIYSTYSGTPLQAGSATSSTWSYVGSSSNPTAGAYITVQNPFLAQHSFVQSSTATNGFAGLTTGVLPNTNSYTAFNLGALTGTLTGGTITVYGYRKQ